MAVLSHSSPVIGTLPRCLSMALEKQYSQIGLECEFEHFDSIEQLKQPDITLAIVKDSFLNDHCVAILDVDAFSVLIADPVEGRYKMSYEKFASIWRFSGIAINMHEKPHI